jgi:hypothetical protein
MQLHSWFFLSLGAECVGRSAHLVFRALITQPPPLTPHPRLPGSPEFALHPATVRRNDTSANSVNEWTGAAPL